MPEFKIGDRWIGDGHAPIVFAEAGIHHGGDMNRARQLVDEARWAGAEVVKFQSHDARREMTDLHPWRATIEQASFTLEQERALMAYTESRGAMFLSTPFSIECLDGLVSLGVQAIKIGSGEVSNLPLLRRAASYGLPLIISTGMHGIGDIARALDVVHPAGVPYALLHCTSEYPTQYRNVRLGALAELRESFPDAVIGFSDHSLGIYAALAAVALGASIVEKHFKARTPWDGPDAEVSITPYELRDLVSGARAIHAARGGTKEPLACEASVARLAKHCAVSKRDIAEGSELSTDCVTLKRTNGGLPMAEVIGRKARRYIPFGSRIDQDDIA